MQAGGWILGKANEADALGIHWKISIKVLSNLNTHLKTLRYF